MLNLQKKDRKHRIRDGEFNMKKEKSFETKNYKGSETSEAASIILEDGIIQFPILKIKSENVLGLMLYNINESKHKKNLQSFRVFVVKLKLNFRESLKLIVKILRMPQAEIHIFTAQLKAYFKELLYKYGEFKNIANFLLD